MIDVHGFRARLKRAQVLALAERAVTLRALRAELAGTPVGEPALRHVGDEIVASCKSALHVLSLPPLAGEVASEVRWVEGQPLDRGLLERIDALAGVVEADARVLAAEVEHEARKRAQLRDLQTAAGQLHGVLRPCSAPERHENPAIDALWRLSRAKGGGFVVITAAEGAGELPGGIRRAGSQTLLGAIARVVTSRGSGYQRIDALTMGTGGDELLPDWYVGDVPIRSHPVAFHLRGGRPAVACPRTSLRDRLNHRWALSAQPQVIPDLELDLGFAEDLDAYNRARDQLIEGGQRALLLVDARLFLTRASKLVDLQESAAFRAIRSSVPSGAALSSSRADVVIFGDPLAARLPRHATHAVLTQLGHRHEQGQHPLADVLGNLRLVGESYAGQVRTAEWPRVEKGVHLGGAVEAPDATTTLAALQTGVLRPLPTLARRPSDPTRVMLEFFASWDLGPFERALAREVIGQERLKRELMESLREVRESCAWALRRGTVAPQLPVLAFFGQSGMGKTLVATLMTEHLFGPGFFEHVSLDGKGLVSCLAGAEPQYQGAVDKTALMRFADRTHGMGVFFLDEITRVAHPNGEPLHKALDPLYEPLGSRRLRPAYQAFSDPLPTGAYELANTLFVLGGNVSPRGAVPPPSFASIDELGVVAGRITSILYVDPLLKAQLPEAIRRMLGKHLARDMKGATPRVECTEALVSVVQALVEAKAQSAPLSLRLVDQVATQLRPGIRWAIERFERAPSDVLLLDAPVMEVRR